MADRRRLKRRDEERLDMAQDRKSALVTGAASGIGRATCARLARGGWQVLAVDRDAEALAWAEGVEGVRTLTADVTSPDDNKAMADMADRLFGGLDGVALNAGITGGG